MVSELKPCPNPWCESHVRPDRNYTPFIEKWRSAPEKAVSCPVCPMRGPWVDTETEAITAWNTRTSDPEALEAAFRRGLEAAAGVAIREGNKHLDPENWEDWDDGFCAARMDIERAILAIDPAQHLGRE